MYLFRVGTVEYDEVVFAFAETMHTLRERYDVYADAEHAFNYSPYLDVVSGVYETISRFGLLVDDEHQFRCDINQVAAQWEELYSDD